ncbi:hypothetical protein L6164_032789 [Bauhinia variegata]|uniref:Uncharacterized protein n=1 Tax=Bauhinia variegata TaxID=167791 RepID=A0ACB9KPS1_BAUVA|nr:hypothetical protein L6164_032789 [Bauhinia variegata]
MGYRTLELHVRIFITTILVFAGTFCVGETDLLDVAAINSLYLALGSPPLQGWKSVGGDPCLEHWQGVDCVFSNITAIRLSGMNLGGELGSNLNFPSIIQLDLSNNHIGGIIPLTLPPTIRNFSLSGNKLIGIIPYSFSSLSQLLDLSLSNNLLSGQIPDVLLLLTGLIDMNLSSNSLSGQLPPSMRNLSSLTSLHLQDNQLSGTLDVLQDLPLKDLDIENNLFSGPIPPKLLSIPSFRKDGNPFNTTIIPLSPAPAPSPVAMVPSPGEAPRKSAYSPRASERPMPVTSQKFFKAKNIIYITIAGFFILIALGLCVFMLMCFKKRSKSVHKPKCTESSFESTNQEGIDEKSSQGYGKENRRMNSIPEVQDEKEMHVKRVYTTSTRNKGHELENTGLGSKLSPLQPPPRSLRDLPGEKVVVSSAIHAGITGGQVMTNSIKAYTIASLQQYTNSFSQESCIGEGTLGSVYRAELPDGKLLAVRKLDPNASKGQNHEQFLQLVSGISSIQHANVVKLLGYCTEYGQRLLVYEYCSNGTLHDALHVDNELHMKLSWNVRVRLAVGAARALEYLHENFQPPIVHRNFRSANVLLNDELEVRVSDCGLGPLLSSGSAGQMSDHLLGAQGYGAPEFEFGSYTQQSDVYSFGVVMLELLTGRKSHDKSRPRAEQFLVRWAVPQLHDIDALSKMVDPSLNGAYHMKSLSRFADIISSCVQHEPEFRPAMSEIVQNLLRMI